VRGKCASGHRGGEEKIKWQGGIQGGRKNIEGVAGPEQSEIEKK